MRSDLGVIFNPRSIAVVGASSNPEKLGYAFVKNILDYGFRGQVYPVNPQATSILGLRCFRDVSELPDGVELAAVVLPATKVPGVLEALAQRGVRGAVVPGGGFAEIGGDGRELQEAIVRISDTYGFRVLGPNVPGFINADASLVATISGGPLGQGPLAIVSQAGSVGYLLIRTFKAESIEFGRFLCIGNQADISEADVIEYLASDPHVKAICLYLEGTRDGRRFLDVVTRTSAVKPVVVLKGGRTPAGHGAILSHTASVSSPERIYRAAFRQTGAVQADSVRALGMLGFALAHQAPAAGDRVAIVTSLAGVGVIAADNAERRGLRVTPPSEATAAKLRDVIPPIGSLRNPFDLTGDVSPAMLARTVAILLESDDYDALIPLVMGVPGSVEFGNGAYASAVTPVLKSAVARGKAVSVSWVMDEANGAELSHVRRELHAVGVPVSLVPEEAVDVMVGLVEYGRSRRRVSEPAAGIAAPAHWRALVRDHVRATPRQLTEHEGKTLLERAGLPVVPSRLATAEDEAASLAAAVGFPVVLKLQSPDVIHKSDIGGVVLGLGSEEDVRRSYVEIVQRFHVAHPAGRLDGVSVQPMRSGGVELVCGVSEDAQFGKYAIVGLGGVHVEVLDDFSLRMLPITEAVAGEMLGELKSAALVAGYRGRPGADRHSLVRTIVELCALASLPEIIELEANPLLAQPVGTSIVDVRIRLRAAPTPTA